MLGKAPAGLFGLDEEDKEPPQGVALAAARYPRGKHEIREPALVEAPFVVARLIRGESQGIDGGTFGGEVPADQRAPIRPGLSGPGADVADVRSRGLSAAGWTGTGRPQDLRWRNAERGKVARLQAVGLTHAAVVAVPGRANRPFAAALAGAPPAPGL